MTRLLLVSQPSIRFGLRMRLKLEPDMMLVGEAGDGLAALAQASVLRPDVILVDIESAGMDGIELIKATIRRRAQTAGAAVFVSKHELGDRAIQAIRQAAGERERLPNHVGSNIGKALT